jgi:methylmalonyl-CoA/ethylmalonyl-CoA epimerase
MTVVLRRVILFAASSAGLWAQSPDAGKIPQISPRLVSISVANLDESIAWYHDNLGFAVQRRADLPKYSLRVAFVERHGFQLELVEFADSVPYTTLQKHFPQVDDRAKIQGLGKLAFVVDDLDGLSARLKKNQVQFFRDITRDSSKGPRWFIVVDNDGNWIQFFERQNRK